MANNTFTYNFQDMKKWYTDHLNNEDIFELAPEIHIWKFNKAIDSKKKEGYLENFLLKSIRQIRLFKPISEKYAKDYKNNVYIILDYDPNWVLFVYPTTKYDNNGSVYPYLFADHYSVPFNAAKLNTKNQIQFHETLYMPNRGSDNVLGIWGYTQHLESHFKNNTTMYTNSYKDELFRTYFGNTRKSILDMLKFYVTSDISDSETNNGGGGTKRPSLPIPLASKKTKIKPVLRKSSKKIEVEKEDLLVKKWKKYKLDHAFICAMKNNNTDKYGVTVKFYDHQIRTDGEVHDGFFFVMDTLDTNFIKNKVIEHIQSRYRQSSGLRHIMSID